MKIAFVYTRGRLERLDAVTKGEAPTEFFYGALELARAGHQVGHFEIDPHVSWDFISAGLDLPRRFKVGPFKTDGQTIRQALAMCPELNRYDLIVATASQIAFALALGTLTGRLRRPILAIQCGLINHQHNWIRHSCMKALLQQMHSMLFGDSERQPMLDVFGLRHEQVSVNQFGVDTAFWQPGTAASSGVLAVGNDGRRDYATLLAAAPAISAPVQIVTSRILPEQLPENVTHLRGSWHQPALSDAALRAMYQAAKCVVVPLQPSLQPSGQSVALQAMACGRPVVLTVTDGLWSREMMVDGKNVLLCRPNDPRDLAEKVNYLLTHPADAHRIGMAGRETACTQANIQNFAALIESFWLRRQPEWDR